MSVTYSLCCPEMNLRLWIGQSRMGTEFYVYSDEKETMKNLADFLIKTKGKPLFFINDCTASDWFYDCEEYEGEEI